MEGIIRTQKIGFCYSAIVAVGLIGLMGVTSPILLAQQIQSDLPESLAMYDELHRDKAIAEEFKQIIELDLVDVSVEQALTEIALKTDLKLMYSESLLQTEKKVTLQKANITLYSALWKVLDETDIRFALSHNRQLVLMKMQVPEPIKLMQETVTGIVTDAQSGATLPAVNVSVKGTVIGTSTNEEGRYDLTNVPSLQDTLIFSFIGYQTREIPIEGRANVDVQLTSQTLEGDEVVVTAFGLERERKALTYSTQDVNTEQLSEARELNPVDALTGKVAGLTITQGGQGIGSNSRVVLRGERSIRGNSSPLYIVDGVPSSMDAVSPDDIESIDVMKGPNAAALYGSSAQNGAIIITTRQADKGQVEFSFSNTFTLEDAMDLQNYQNIYGQGSGGVYSPSSEFSWGPRMEGQMVDHWSPDPNMSGEQYTFLPQPDNNSDVFQAGYSSASNIMASIGGETTQSMFSYTYTDGQGIVPGNELRRHNVSMRITSQVTDRLSLDSRLSYVMQNIDNEVGFGQQFDNAMRHTYRLPRNIRTADIKNFEFETVDGLTRQNFWNPGSNGGANPYWTLNRNLNERPREKVSTFASLTYDISDRLSLMIRGSVNSESVSWKKKMYNDTYVLAEDGYYGESKDNSRGMQGDFLLSYTRDITEDWSLDANIGGTISSWRNSSLSGDTGIGGSGGLIIPNLFTLSNTQNIQASNSIGSPSDLQSLYSFGQISWRNSIFLDVTGRNDWSSTLPAHNRSYFYPSIGLSAVITDLVSLFPETLSFAKVRASWAKVGNTAPPFHFARSASIRPGGYNGLLSLSGTLPNPDLKPEETESIELGLDLQFFEGRLGFDITAYQSNTRNQLFQISTPVGTATSSAFTNGGDVQNRGLEVLLSVSPIETRNFVWDLDFNFSKNENLVKSLSTDIDILTLSTTPLVHFRIEEGRPFGELYGRGFEKDDDGSVIIGGDGMPQITSGYDVPVANYNPDFLGGISNRLNYKNFSLSFLIDHRQGGTIASWTNAILNFDGVTEVTLNGRDGGLVFGENLFPDETAVLEDGSTNDIAIDAETFWRGVGGRTNPIGEVFVEDATNTRLRELTLGYRLPQSILAGFPISNIKFSLVGRNLFFIYRASEGMDPEFNRSTSASQQGIHTFAPPTTRSFGANLKIDF